MADDNTPPPRGGNPLKQLGSFAKKNRVMLAVGGAAGGFLLLANRGGGGSGEPAASTYGTIVPVMRELSDNDGGAADDPLGSDIGGGDPVYPDDPILAPDPLPADVPLPEDAPEPAPPSETPAATEQAPAKTAASAAAAPPESGVTISGTTIPGAIGRTSSGAGRNSYGEYTDWLVRFPSGSAHYYHYYKDEHGKPKDKLTGPHDSKGTIPSSARVGSDSPTAAPAPVVRPGTQANPGAGAGQAPIVRPAGSTYQDWYVWQADGDVHEYRVYTSGPARLPDYRGKKGNYGKAPTGLSSTLQAQGWGSNAPAGLPAVVVARFYKLVGSGTI